MSETDGAAWERTGRVGLVSKGVCFLFVVIALSIWRCCSFLDVAWTGSRCLRVATGIGIISSGSLVCVQVGGFGDTMSMVVVLVHDDGDTMSMEVVERSVMSK